VDLTDGLSLRHAHPDDYARVLTVIGEWWDGRPASFVIESDTELVGFLLGCLADARR